MQFDHKNRQIRPTTKLISEFFLVVPFNFTIFSLKCREKRGKTVYTLPVTQILDLFSLFTCLFTSQQRGRALKKLKATTITKLKIGFLTTLSSECIWQQFFFTNFFEFLLPTKMPFLKRFYSHEFSNQNSNFSWGLNGGSMVRKIRVILNIKNLELKSKIKNQKSKIKFFDILKIPIWQII